MKETKAFNIQNIYIDLVAKLKKAGIVSKSYVDSSVSTLRTYVDTQDQAIRTYVDSQIGDVLNTSF